MFSVNTLTDHSTAVYSGGQFICSKRLRRRLEEFTNRQVAEYYLYRHGMLHVRASYNLNSGYLKNKTKQTNKTINLPLFISAIRVSFLEYFCVNI